MARFFTLLAFLAVIDGGWAQDLKTTPVRRGESMHWAYRPLARPSVPRLTNQTWIRSPVDAFIGARLESIGILPSPETDARTWIRRVSFDLTGLPPTPAEVRTFLADKSPNAFERLVDRLLASRRYGERWARHWIDVAHFAETHGHDQDRIRTNAWPYRDYLIASFNEDKPYQRFVEEQVAGDILFPYDPNATVALGFLAAGPWDESSLRDIREDTVDRQLGRYLDRDDVLSTVMQTFSSATVQCARCHDHKFDPISQADYYALQAVFAGVDRANRAYDRDSTTHHRRQHLLRTEQQIGQGRTEAIATAEARQELAEWEKSIRKLPQSWVPLHARTFLSSAGSKLTRQADASILATGRIPDRDTYSISVENPGWPITAVRLELLTDATLPHQGPGRRENGNLHLTEFEVMLFTTNATPQPVSIRAAYADFNQTGWNINHALDGNEKSAWGIHPAVGQAHEAIFELQQPLTIPAGATLVFQLKQLHGEGHVIGRFRLSATDRERISGFQLAPDLAKILIVRPEMRTDSQQKTLAIAYFKNKVARELATLPPPDHVYAAASYFEPDASHKPAGGPRPVHVLRRGDIGRPGEAAVPGALSCLEDLPARFSMERPQDEGARRAALAKWLSATTNPLTWRSVVNRVWHYHFGRGLVETPNDFGRMGANPSHPELLDWLAIWFRDEAQGSLKQLHRLLVTSAVYRQSSSMRQRLANSAVSADGAEPLDPDNRLLWRMPRARLDAEQIRDAILQIGGRLDLREGGASDRNFDLQPGGHVTPLVDYNRSKIIAGTPERRGIFRFLFRTLPDPFMEALDCPAGDQLTPVRHSSVTVQQALALWNNAFIARHCENLAALLERQGGTLPEQVQKGFESVLGRTPSAVEAAESRSYAQQHGLASLCRVLFNSNEFMFLD